MGSDSDFTRLAQRQREEGLEVYCFGERNAVEAFRNACNRFIYVENLLETEPGEKKEDAASAGTAAQKKDAPSRARKIIAGAIGDRYARVIDLRDGGPPPFPLDDLRLLYDEVRDNRPWGLEAHYAPLRAVLDPVRHALLGHPVLPRVAVAGRLIGDNRFSMEILGSGGDIYAGTLIAGLMARTAELLEDGLREMQSPGIYADEPGGRILQEALQLTHAAQGANVVLRIPNDETLFEDAVEPAPGIFCANPVVTYLGLWNGNDRDREAADHLAAKCFPWL